LCCFYSQFSKYFVKIPEPFLNFVLKLQKQAALGNIKIIFTADWA